MKKIMFEGTEVKAYSGNEMRDFPKWLLNKLNGEVLKELEWLSDRQIDYEDLKRLTAEYQYILLLDKKPENGNLVSMRHSFKAYEVTIEYTHYTMSHNAKAIAFVPRQQR